MLAAESGMLASLRIIPVLIALAAAAWPGTATAARPCGNGDLRCVDAVVREMNQRFTPLARSCDHDAIFALAYLRTTEAYRATVANDPRFFDDPTFVNRVDVVFADYYFSAYDAWHAGGAAPGAWAIAFKAADERLVSGPGNLLLGINAHVSRDLPFVMASLGLVRPDGSSRKPDHDRVNEILKRVVGPLLTELSRRFDPAFATTAENGTELDEEVLFQLLVAWRELAWRNAELLAASSLLSPARDFVAATIEAEAAAEARAILTTYEYRKPLQNSGSRDAYCEAHADG
jgi:hypothetical protein